MKLKAILAILIFFSPLGGGPHFDSRDGVGSVASAKQKGGKKGKKGKKGKLKIRHSGVVHTMKEATDERIAQLGLEEAQAEDDAASRARFRRAIETVADEAAAAEYLQKRGLTREELNTPDSFGFTRLHYAVMYEWHKVAKLLIEQGADPTVKDGSGRSARDWAAKDSRMSALLAGPIPTRPR